MAISLVNSKSPLVSKLNWHAVKDKKIVEKGIQNLYTQRSVARANVDPQKVQKMYERILRDPGFNWRGTDLCRLHPEYAAAIESKLNLPAKISKNTNLPAVITKTQKEAPKGFKGLLGKIIDGLKGIAKTKKGKIGIAAGLAATLISGGVYLYGRNKDNVEPPSDSSPINDLANLPVNGNMTANGPYTVANKDNMWIIAREHLLKTHEGEKDYKPSDVEIMQHLEELMQLNNLQYEKDSYKVVIQPNQSLKLVA